MAGREWLITGGCNFVKSEFSLPSMPYRAIFEAEKQRREKRLNIHRLIQQFAVFVLAAAITAAAVSVPSVDLAAFTRGIKECLACAR